LTTQIVFKQSTRDLRCVQRIQRLALDSFPTITTYEQLSNSEKAVLELRSKLYHALPSPTVEKLSTEYRTPGKNEPNPPYSVPPKLRAEHRVDRNQT